MKNKIKVKNCKICGKKFEARPPQNKFCCKECKEVNNKNIKLDYKHKIRELKNVGKEGYNYVICKICGERMNRIYGKHLKEVHNITSIEYKEMFPNTKLHTDIDNYNISKNSGKFMKQNKYRKWASDRLKGENNPNHKSKTTEQQRKEISPFSKEFYKKRDLTEEDRKEFIKRATLKKCIKFLNEKNT